LCGCSKYILADAAGGVLFALGLLGHRILDVALNATGKVPGGVVADLIAILLAARNANPIGLIFAIHDVGDLKKAWLKWVSSLKTRTCGFILTHGIKV
jgi:hypothetical protein